MLQGLVPIIQWRAANKAFSAPADTLHCKPSVTGWAASTAPLQFYNSLSEEIFVTRLTSFLSG